MKKMIMTSIVVALVWLSFTPSAYAQWTWSEFHTYDTWVLDGFGYIQNEFDYYYERWLYLQVGVDATIFDAYMRPLAYNIDYDGWIAQVEVMYTGVPRSAYSLRVQFWVWPDVWWQLYRVDTWTITLPPPYITTQTIIPILDRSRTTIGSAERVKCFIEPPAEVTWSVPLGCGSVEPQTGTFTIYTAPRLEFNYNCTVSATAPYDSADISFYVITPNNVSAIVITNSPYGPPNPNGTYMGAFTVFKQRVSGDSPVSFYYLPVRENIPYQMYLWPDGTPYLRDADLNPVPWDNYYCEYWDYVGSSLHHKSKLWFPGYGYMGCDIPVMVPMEYQMDDGEWNMFYYKEHIRKYRASDFKAMLYLTSGASGSWQGPYSSW